jgi:hypothetical protein
MKKLIVILLFLSNYVFSQEKKANHTFNIKYSPQHLVMKANQISFEFVYNKENTKSISLTLGRTFEHNQSDRDKYTWVKSRGFHIALEHRFYFSGHSEKGFYLAPSAKFEYLSVDFSQPVAFGLSLDSMGISSSVGLAYLSNIQNIHSFTPSCNIGFQFVFFKYMILDIYAGLGYRYSYSTFDYPKSQGMLFPMWRRQSEWLEATFDRAYTGILPKLGFQIGVAF